MDRNALMGGLEQYLTPWMDRPEYQPKPAYGPEWSYPLWAAQNGEVRNALDRPRDWSAPIAEAISPTMGGYGLGSGGAKVYSHAKEREWLPAAEEFGLLAAGMIAPGPKGARPRAVDPTGYYSQALEAAHGLKQAKGTPEQMLAQLKSAGVKQAEMDATGLPSLLAGKSSITRDEIVRHLESNRVGLREVVRENSATAKYDAAAMDVFGQPYDRLTDDQRSSVRNFVDRGLSMPFGATKFSSYSLDPSNPSYRETVLRLPSNQNPRWLELRKQIDRLQNEGGIRNMAEINRLRDEADALDGTVGESKDFQSGHFPEPNIVGHLMTSMVKHEGKPVYLIDQIQSDWGQRLRDKGVRDEAKISELRKQGEALQQEYDRVRFSKGKTREEVQQIADRIKAIEPELVRLAAELRTAESSASGHPLVNTTDQWTNTTLRKGLMQAADANADYIAIPSGKTVLSYNPGDQHGMEAFYNQIIPKNLGNLMSKLDPAQVNRLYADTLETPGKGQAGQGFSLFSLSPETRDRIKQGLPLFAVPAAVASMYGDAVLQATGQQQPRNALMEPTE